MSSAEDAFALVALQLITLVIREQNFMSDLFHLSPRAPKNFSERPRVLPRILDKTELTRKREAIKDVKLRGRLL